MWNLHSRKLRFWPGKHNHRNIHYWLTFEINNRNCWRVFKCFLIFVSERRGCLLANYYVSSFWIHLYCVLHSLRQVKFVLEVYKVSSLWTLCLSKRRKRCNSILIANTIVIEPLNSTNFFEPVVIYCPSDFFSQGRVTYWNLRRFRTY